MLTKLVRRFGAGQEGQSAQPKGRIYKPNTLKEMKDEADLNNHLNLKDKYVIVSFFVE